jgi:ABC-type uncharacterized transport system YnjBCD permease subunit
MYTLHFLSKWFNIFPTCIETLKLCTMEIITLLIFVRLIRGPQNVPTLAAASLWFWSCDKQNKAKTNWQAHIIHIGVQSELCHEAEVNFSDSLFTGKGSSFLLFCSIRRTQT